MNPYSLKNHESLELRDIENMADNFPVAGVRVSGFECNLTDLLSAWPREHSHVPATPSAYVVAGSTCPAWMASSFVGIHIQLTTQVS